MLFGFEDQAATTGEQAGAVTGAAGQTLKPSASTKGSRSGWFAAAGLVVGVALASLVFGLWPDGEPALDQVTIEQVVNDALDARDAQPTQAVVAFEQIASSVVGVRATTDDNAPAAIGAGVVINDQGQVLTANHGIVGASSIDLLLPDGSLTTAIVDSVDPARDIAVLSVVGGGNGLVPAVLGNPRSLRVGDDIFAVGNPLGLTTSMTAGVVSGLARSINSPGAQDDPATSDVDESRLEGLIQFDAAISEGSSGGPLINADGHVVGIVVALAGQDGQNSFLGIGFAMPIDLATQRAADGPSQ